MSLTIPQSQALQERLQAAASQVEGRSIAEHVESVLAKPAHKSHAASERFKAEAKRRKAEQ